MLRPLEFASIPQAQLAPAPTNDCANELMSLRTRPHFVPITWAVSDHVGSLLGPLELIGARRAYAEGRIEDDTLREREDNPIREAVAMQRSFGFESATDGE